jgi:hypothetical protein
MFHAPREGGVMMSRHVFIKSIVLKNLAKEILRESAALRTGLRKVTNFPKMAYT